MDKRKPQNLSGIQEVFILMDLLVSGALANLHIRKVFIYQDLRTGGAFLKIHLGTSSLILSRMEEAQGDQRKPIKFLKACA